MFKFVILKYWKNLGIRWQKFEVVLVIYEITILQAFYLKLYKVLPLVRT